MLLGRRALLVYVLAIAAVAATMALPHVLASPRRSLCQEGLVHEGSGKDGYCVGLTDGKQIFARPLAGLEHRIYQENQSVARSRAPWVGLAYLIPMSLDQASTETLEGVIDHLRGAFTAQMEANTGMANGDSPLIKLYLVNEGPQEGQWQIAVNQILAGIHNGRHVVAVAGMGQSLQPTYDAAKQFAAHHLSMFGATITADGLNGAQFEGLVRVAPTNTDEVRAALEFLGTQPPGDRSPAMIVQDKADNQDPYVSTWVHQVETLYPGPGHSLDPAQPESFDRTLASEGDRFTEIAQDICNDKPKVIFFAGRAKDLEKFIGSLDGRQCNAPVTVISGDDDIIDSETGTKGQYRDFNDALGGDGVSFYSTALANPDEWTLCGDVPPSQNVAVGIFKSFITEFTDLFGQAAESSLRNGSIILARDAVSMAIYTIRLGEKQSKTSHQPRPYSYQTVTQQLYDLYGKPYAGASGVITISGDGLSTGDPVNKPLAIVQHEPNGILHCVRVEVPAS